MFMSSKVDRASTKKVLAQHKRQLAEANQAIKFMQSDEEPIVNEMTVSIESDEAKKRT